jgi:hypothetical protein
MLELKPTSRPHLRVPPSSLLSLRLRLSLLHLLLLLPHLPHPTLLLLGSLRLRRPLQLLLDQRRHPFFPDYLLRSEHGNVTSL